MERHWGLQRNPFVDPNGGVAIVATPVLEEALARLDYLCRRRRRLGIVYGQSGFGKTVVLRSFRRELLASGESSALMTAAGCDGDEAQYRFADAFGALRSPLRTPGDVRRAVTRAVENLAMAEQPLVLLIDDLDRAAPGFMEALLALTKVGEHAGAPLSIAAASSFGGVPANVVAQTDLTIRLAPWPTADVQQALSDLLAAVGRSEPAFDDQSIWRIQELAGGVPRLVMRLAELALVAGAADGRGLVTVDLVDAVASEILPPAAPPRFDGVFAD
ncbi:MAG TPA: AAA family ATPase [Pirellulaceae bacterium]|jgi:type II secretory pathway predicted ATPase ExeA|nr:AAA family ATPase [Pirellulaceae bacterium]